MSHLLLLEGEQDDGKTEEDVSQQRANKSVTQSYAPSKMRWRPQYKKKGMALRRVFDRFTAHNTIPDQKQAQFSRP